MKVEGLPAYQQAEQAGVGAAGVTTARLGVEVSCKNKRFCGAKIKYGIIIRMAKTADQKRANQIYWTETDHWIDNDEWYLKVGIPESEKLEKLFMNKEYFFNLGNLLDTTSAMYSYGPRLLPSGEGIGWFDRNKKISSTSTETTTSSFLR